MIKAIETRFHGTLFRSRLEARWAVFFSELNLPWLYEPEGFDLSTKKYLPDFWLPRQKTWVEVKPGDFAENCQHLSELATATKSRVLLVKGSIPAFPPNSYGTPENELGGDWSDLYFPGEWIEAPGFESGNIERTFVEASDTPFYFCRCKHCGEYGIEFLGRSERIRCCPENKGHKDYTADEQTIVDAYAEARTRRFEHGDFDQWR